MKPRHATILVNRARPPPPSDSEDPASPPQDPEDIGRVRVEPNRRGLKKAETPEEKARAEDFKNKGNDALRKREFERAAASTPKL